MRSRSSLAALGVLLLLTSAPAVPAADDWTPIAVGLNNPRQMSFAPDGTLFVAEAGTGKVGATDQSGKCTVGPEGPACTGNTSSITFIPHPATATPADAKRLLGGLMSVAGADTGTGATGLDALSITKDGRIYGIFTYVPQPLLPHSVARMNGKLIGFDVQRHLATQADIGAYSLAHPLPGHEPDSDPYGVLAVEGHVFVADAANNTLLDVREGKITTLATFRHRPADAVDGVPTSIARGPDGRLYVGELGSLVPGEARVSVWEMDGTHVKDITGLDEVTSVAVDANGYIYATELFAGKVLKLDPDGNVVASSDVPLPGGLAVDDAGNVYVSVFSIFPGAGPFPGHGMVWRGSM